MKNTILLLFSLIFYAWGEPRYVLLMLAEIIVCYVSGLLLEHYRGRKYHKLILVVSVIICLTGLIYFKYADFFIDNFNYATELSVPLLKLALPIGISFYTFQIISYLIDVYRHDTNAQRNIISLAAYVTLFAQLVAGPIVRYTDIEKQLNERKQSFKKVLYGINRFVIGLSKKILIANLLGELTGVLDNFDEKTVGGLWVCAIAYTLQIYFDFSGYSDMAIGLGSIFGFDFPENFNYPYISGSITEFWRRWHMTLSSWFRDYVYIPLGGNRVSKVKWYRNIFVVWLLTGFWHGASWNFIIWGLYFAILLVLEKQVLSELLKKNKVVSHLYVLFLVSFSFVIFKAESLPLLIEEIRGMLRIGDIPLWSEQTTYYVKSYFILLIIAAVGATPLTKNIVDKMKGKLPGVLETIVVTGLLLVCTAFLVDGSFNPFLYFRF